MRRIVLPAILLATVLGGIPSVTRAASVGTAPTANYLCLIVLDGGKPEYITNHLKTLPNLRQLINAGRWYDRAWVGDLMSITPPGHAVIGTGSFPKDDGGIV